MINLTQSTLFDFKGQTIISPWDRLKKHVFQSYPVHVTPSTNDTEDLLLIAREYENISDMIWIVDDSKNINPDFPWHYKPSDIAHDFIHFFPRIVRRTGRDTTWGDIKLVPTSGIAHGVLNNKIVCSYHDADFAVVMISFHEAEADQNYQKLKQVFPDALHVKNVEGIANAHKEAASICNTEMVYIVDADADIHSTFKFDYIPPMSKRKNTTYVWSALNPINDLEYGYGAVKLFPREQLIEMGHDLPDFSQGVSFYQPVSDVSNTTMFNKDPFRTWRSAFRECVKLASNVSENPRVNEEASSRLETWCTVDNGARFGRYCVKGALEGKAYGIEHKDNVELLHKINDFEWLREQFIASMKKRISAD